MQGFIPKRLPQKLLEYLFEDHGIVLFLIACPEEERNRFPLCPLGQLLKLLYLSSRFQLIPVAPLKFLPLPRVVPEPSAEGGGRGEVPPPPIDPGLLSRQTPGPDALDEDPDAIGTIGPMKYPLDPDQLSSLALVFVGVIRGGPPFAWLCWLKARLREWGSQGPRESRERAELA